LRPVGNTRRIVVCVNRRLSDTTPSCAGRGSEVLVNALRDVATEQGLDVEVATFSCFGRCVEGPNVRFSPGGPFFRGVTGADVEAIVSAFIDWNRAS